jgi:hypothetical protein
VRRYIASATRIAILVPSASDHFILFVANELIVGQKSAGFMSGEETTGAHSHMNNAHRLRETLRVIGNEKVWDFNVWHLRERVVVSAILDWVQAAEDEGILEEGKTGLAIPTIVCF